MPRIPCRSRNRASYPSAALTVLLPFVVNACGGKDLPTDVSADGECGWSGAGSSSYTLENPGPPPIAMTGTQTRWDHNLRLISLGPEEVGDDEPDLAITMVISEPTSTDFGCGALVTWGNLVAHEVQVGNSDEIGARYYELVDAPCAEETLSQVRIQSIGRDAIMVSAFCVAMQRIIVLPDGSSERGEIVRFGGSFTAVAR